MTLTGHGASAALATLAALDLAEGGVPIADLVTFGEPRVGNSAFAAFYEDSAVYPHFRVTRGRDPVVRAPSASADFASCSASCPAFCLPWSMTWTRKW